MFRDKLFYYLANYTLQHTFEKEVVKFINKKRRLVIFDVGCYRGIFVKTILNLVGRKKNKFYLFDINKKVKKYIQNLIKFNNFYYNEIALSDKNGAGIGLTLGICVAFIGLIFDNLIRTWVEKRKKHLGIA